MFRKNINFFKMQGCGNDYVYVNAFEEKIDNPGSLARRISNRHFGIGSDGLILLKPAQAGGDVRMVMFNADGSESEMCGNGIRCLAKLAYDLEICFSRELRVETLGGIKEVELIFQGTRVTGAKVAMGKPSFERADVPMTGSGSAIDITMEAAGQKVTGSGVNLGNPHFVIFKESIDDKMLTTLGPALENHADFPNRVNVEFIEVISRKAIHMRVWERGSGETLACGTGACAALAAAVKTKRTDRSVICQLKGGDLELSWPSDDSQIYMTGPAVLVFKGELYDF